MARVSVRAARTRFGALLDRVSRGEEVVITRHGKPVARLVREDAERLGDARRAVAGLRESQQRIRRRSKAKLSDREFRSAIRERSGFGRDKGKISVRRDFDARLGDDLLRAFGVKP